MNFKVISRNVGFALLTSAFFMFLSILVSVAGGNDSALAALLISFVITFIIGVFPFIFVRQAQNITLQDGYMIIFLSWTLSFVVGMLPYLLWGGPFTVVNAWFESVSGYTTTGSTILENVEALPPSLLFWRSSTHFIGGLGVVVFLLLIIPSSSPLRRRLANMELSALTRDAFMAKTNKTVYIFTYIYIGLALAAFICYILAGMSPFDAINHAFSVVSTGGFSTRNLSIGYYDSPAVNIVTIVFMMLCSIHFAIIYMVIATRSLRPLNNSVLKFYVGYVIVAALIMTVNFHSSGEGNGWADSAMKGLFMTATFSSTTGFSICDTGAWTSFPHSLMMVVALFCGMAGSTSGGMKVDRLVVLLKAFARQVRNTLHPSSVAEVRMGHHVVKDEDIHPHILFIAIYVLLLLLSVLLVMLFCGGDANALDGVVSSMGNLGLSFGELSSHYNGEPMAAKLIYTLDMLLGRIEIYPVFAVLYLVFGRSNRK